MPKIIEMLPGTTEIAPGWSVVIKPAESPLSKVIPGSTARHEATHVVPAILTGSSVHLATRRPGPGYLGLTVLGENNPIAAIAPHAFGHNGTGYDVMLVTYQGHDLNSLASAARSLLLGHEKEIDAVAALIEVRGTISGFEAKEAMDKVADPEMQLELIDPLGKRQFVTKTRGSLQ